ncbi:MAG TPA: hypothetical protein VKR22_00570 [Acidimicrobiales bacterium]|nr:hypothetical protein [Acidimicrobiales bacterium]
MAERRDTHHGPSEGGTDDAATVRDQAAWDALVERLSGPLWATARGHGLDPGEAAEVCQLAWMRLTDHLSDFASDAEIAVWLCAVVNNEVGRLTAGGLGVPHGHVCLDEHCPRDDSARPVDVDA